MGNSSAAETAGNDDDIKYERVVESHDVLHAELDTSSITAYAMVGLKLADSILELRIPLNLGETFGCRRVAWRVRFLTAQACIQISVG